MSSSTLAPGGPSYASVVARQKPDPDILALKEELAELKTTIQTQQQQPQQPSAPLAHPWIAEIPSSLIQHPSLKSVKLIGNIAWIFPQS
jgi:hypothetical protein